jgi:imidazolonepropionase-like amidohydrolase
VKIIRTGQLIDGTGSDPVNAAVLVVGDDGAIQRITQGEGDLPQDCEVVDLRSFQVVPGLIDSHDHLCIDMADERVQAEEPLTWQTMKGVYNAGRCVRGGVTTLRDLGEEAQIDKPLRQMLNQNAFPSPQVLSCGQFITRRGGHGWYAGRQVDNANDIRAAVREQLQNDADFIKAMVSGGISTKGSNPVGQELTAEEIEVLVEESHRANRKVSVHLHGGPGAKVAIAAGVDSVEHGMHLTPEEVQMLADNGTYLVVTYAVTELSANAPEVPDYYREKAIATLDTYKNVIREARERGVRIAVGGDGVHGRPALELRALVKAGFTPLQAMLEATRNGAELAGLSDTVGSLEAGKRADLVAIDGDVTRDVMALEDVRYVMRNGKEQYPTFSWSDANLTYVR